MSPQRIQRKRTKGWRMPEGAVYVGRPTKWGNPFPAIPNDDQGHREAAAVYRRYVFGANWSPEFAARARDELADKDLACWCALDQPCHADVLLELANGEPS